MPSFLIHIAVAKQYLKKHKEYDEKEFIKGTIAPDLIEDKTKSHYGKESAQSDVKAFIKDYPEETSFNMRL